MSSAVCFNLDQSKILSSGNGLMIPFPVSIPKPMSISGLNCALCLFQFHLSDVVAIAHIFMLFLNFANTGQGLLNALPKETPTKTQ